MMLKSVSSSCLKATGYNPETETLYVQFISGTIYEYYNVPQIVYDEMLSAPSMGNYLTTKVAKAYNYSKVEEENQ
jgi:hypothetical protein